MLKLFLIVISVLTGASILTYLIQHDEGFILINFGSSSLEVRFWFGVVILIIALYVLFWLLRRVRALIVKLGVTMKWWSESRFKKAQKNTYQGLVHFIEGNHAIAEKELLQAAKVVSDPYLHYLASAESAFQLGQISEAEFLFAKAESSTRGEHLYIQYCYARCDFENENYASCAERLQKLLAREKSNKQVLELLCRALIKQDQFEPLVSLLPQLRKNNIYSDVEFNQLTLNVYLSLLSQMLEKEKPTDAEAKKFQLAEFWRRVPKALKHRPKLVYVYAEHLISVSLDDEAESILSGELNKSWSESLLKLYGVVEPNDVKKQLQHARKWLKKHANNAVLYMVLSKIAIRNLMFDEAKEYIEKSIQISPSVEAFKVLAQLYHQSKQYDKEREYLQKTVALLSNDE